MTVGDIDADGGDGPEDADPNSPIDGQVFMLAVAKASVGPDRLPDLLARAQTDLDGRLDDYRRQFERVAEEDDREIFLVSEGHWETVGDRLGFGRRETDAVRRTHAEQLRRVGSETDRREEFEIALDIREAVVVRTRDGD
jgi:hypothetical protein